MLLNLLASLIKTRPMPCVERVLTGGGVPRGPSTQGSVTVSPADAPTLGLTHGVTGPCWAGLFHSDANIPRVDFTSLFVHHL